MKNVKFWTLAILTTALIFGSGFMTMKTIDERLQAHTPETTETAPECPVETETEIIFTEIEEITDEPTTEIQPLFNDATYEEVSESSQEIQPIAEEVPSVHVETDGEPLNEYDEDVMLLARIIQNEAGADIATDEHQRAVASVVLNRVSDPRFPHDNIREIVMCGWFDGHPIQYNFSSLDEFYALVPSERAIANAEYVLTYGSTIPACCVWQDNSIQGEVVMTFAYPGTGFGVTYICR